MSASVGSGTLGRVSTPDPPLEVGRPTAAPTERLFRLAVEASPSGVVMVDRRGTIVLVNREIERLFGYTRGELVGRSIEVLVPSRFRATHPGAGQEFFSHPQARPLGTGRDLFGVHKDGTEIPVEIGLNPIEAEEGIFVLASVIDIGPRKQAEAELRRSNEELERFAYVASHDLQEPLRTVSSYLQLLSRRYRDRLDADGADFMDFAVDGARRMQQLIADLLVFSRVGTRGAPLVATEMQTAFDQTLASLRAAIEESSATVSADPLPAVLADGSQLAQLLANLIGNGLKFHGEEPPRVRVSARRTGRLWTISVEDNGIGIAPEYFERIFVIFQRLHAREEYPGTGVGLAICKKIVERHGGRLWVESTPGAGARFFFTLQAAD